MSYFSVVRADIAPGAGDRKDEFVRWWADEHQPEYVARDGIQRAWLLERVDHPHAQGEQEQAYTAVYEIDEIESFHRALDAGPPWGPWQPYVDDWLVNWGRTYRRIETVQRGDQALGTYWALVAADFELSPEEVDEFRTWYDRRHIPELLSHPGLHCAWRLELTPHERDLGSRGRRFWANYEVDSPDAFAHARNHRLSNGIEPWDGIWGHRLRGWSISFHRVLSRVDKEQG